MDYAVRLISIDANYINLAATIFRWSSYSVYKRTFAPLAKGNFFLEMVIYSICGALSGATSAVCSLYIILYYAMAMISIK